MKTLVIAERRGDRLLRVSQELAAGAAAFGDVTAVEVTGLDRYSALASLAGLAPEVAAERPDLILLGATPNGRDIGARLAARLGWAYIADCTEARIEDGALVAVRTMYAGKMRATIRATLPAIASVRANAFELPAGAAELQTRAIAADPSAEKVRLARFDPTPTSGGTPIADARIVVSGGRGLSRAENWGVLESLAEVLGAAIGASRAVTDAGWRPNEEQVGQTGKTVAPDLYIALGISGAIQHLAGMSASRVIVAVNKDPQADIFKACDYGVVADLFEFTPALTEAIRQTKTP